MRSPSLLLPLLLACGTPLAEKLTAEVNPVCHAIGEACPGGESCCGGSACFQGVCACSAEHAACGAPGQVCCGNLSCDFSGHCTPACTLPEGACQALGGACSGADAGCCKPGTCQNGRCADPSTDVACGVEGAACAVAADCCGSTTAGSLLDCVPGADGGNVCHLGVPGDPCDNVTRHCTPGVTCAFPPPLPDAGPPDAGPPDAGEDDGGTADAGEIDAGEIDAGGPVDAGPPQGTCRLPSVGSSCLLFDATCALGERCDPSLAQNYGYDPCFYKVVNQNLAYRGGGLLCNGGICTNPYQGQPCVGPCVQTPGDPRRTSCIATLDGSKICMPACTLDSDCRGATVYDGQLNNPQRVTNYCVRYGTAAGCQAQYCFAEGVSGMEDPSVLYKPCDNRPDTVCLPRFVGELSTIIGYCHAVRPDAGSTVGDVCDPRAGREAQQAICGRDAVCLGGSCAAICDASQLGGNGTAACDTSHSCISPQGVDLIADYQVGGCGVACDPFSDLEHSGCVSYCGGPPSRCNWIVGDPVVDQPRGFCTPAVQPAIADRQPCVVGVIDPCEAGHRCLLDSSGVTRQCRKLCDPTVTTGHPDACPMGQACNAFAPLKRSGYCQ